MWFRHGKQTCIISLIINTSHEEFVEAYRHMLAKQLQCTPWLSDRLCYAHHFGRAVRP